MGDITYCAGSLPLLARLPLHADKNLATWRGHTCLPDDPDPSLLSTSALLFKEAAMKLLWSLPLDPLLDEPALQKAAGIYT